MVLLSKWNPKKFVDPACNNWNCKIDPLGNIYIHYQIQIPAVRYEDLGTKKFNCNGIFIKNCNEFLKENGFGILALKARSVDVTKVPKDIFKKTREELNQVMSVVDYRELEPFEKDHALFVCKRKSSGPIEFENIKEVYIKKSSPDKRRNFKNNRSRRR